MLDFGFLWRFDACDGNQHGGGVIGGHEILRKGAKLHSIDDRYTQG